MAEGQLSFTRDKILYKACDIVLELCLTFYNLNRNRRSLNLGSNILYRCFKTENNMDDGRREKGSG